MILPTSDLAIAINEAIRGSDEWFEEDDDLERLAVALASLSRMTEPLAASARRISRIATAQAFAEETSEPRSCSGDGFSIEMVLTVTDSFRPTTNNYRLFWLLRQPDRT